MFLRGDVARAGVRDPGVHSSRPLFVVFRRKNGGDPVLMFPERFSTLPAIVFFLIVFVTIQVYSGLRDFHSAGVVDLGGPVLTLEVLLWSGVPLAGLLVVLILGLLYGPRVGGRR